VTSPKKILVFQTAFLGDVILSLPMIQLLHKQFPLAEIDVVTTPRAADLLFNHPAISTVIPYDKRKSQKGFRDILRLATTLREEKYDIAVVPHRSLRTAIIIALSAIPCRVTFDTSAGKFLYNHIVRYEKTVHEIDRNNSLLTPLNIKILEKEFPSLYPSEHDQKLITKYLFEREILQQEKMIAIAPGSVWNTKRWLLERFIELSLMLANDGWEVLIIGGKEDTELGSTIVETSKHKNIQDCTGKLTLLQSAELIGRCRALVTNDSAPLHIAVAMRTPVVSIFGATVPAFGFGPYGENDIVIEINGLHCRPCAIHGGDKCPIRTFDCMKKIDAITVFNAVERTTLF
jgi:heptosyltransferase II